MNQAQPAALGMLVIHLAILLTVAVNCIAIIRYIRGNGKKP